MSYTFNPPLEVSDFSGGMTDNYIDGPVNSGQVVDNLLITKNRKLRTRPGRLIYNSTYYQIPAGNQRIGALINHPGGELFIQSGRKLNYISSGWQELTSPTSASIPAFSANAVTNYISWDNWQNHVYLVSDSFSDPIKVYKDSTNTWRVRTAGLPSLDLEGAIDLANDIKAQYNLHRVQGTRHATNDTVNAIASSDAYDFDTLVTLTTELLTDIAAHLADASLAAAWAYHRAQVVSSLASTTAPTSIQECVDRLLDIKSKYNTHDASNVAHNAGTSRLSTVSQTPIITGTAGTADFIYRFYFFYEYTVGNVIFQDLGPTYEVEANDLTDGTKSIASIPAINNGTSRCYDTATIKVKIARTAAAGNTFYAVGEVTNGTTTFSDTVTDSALVDNDPLYTNGGSLDNDPPPRAKFLKIVNNVAVYANIKEGTIAYGSKFKLSKPGDPDSVPGEFEDNAEEDITGVSNISIYPIIFTRNRIYRVEGFFDETGRGTIAKREVSRVKGCISNRGIVQIPQGLVFPGTDGFYFTDGYSVQPISIHLVESYSELVSSAAVELQIEGIYDSAENRVYWTVQRDSASSDNDAHFVLDLNYGLKPEAVFTTESGGDSWRNTCFAIYNGTFVMGDEHGYLFKYDSNTATDPVVDVLVVPSSWATTTVIHDYTNCASSFGSSRLSKWITDITLECKNETNSTIQIFSNNDDSNLFRPLKEVRFLENIVWGDPSIVWGSTEFNYFWNVAQIIEARRRFPAGSLRCNYKQIQITNAYTIIYRSDDYATADINGATNTATLTSGAVPLPTDIVGYNITFEADDYTLDYEITARSSSTELTFSDGGNDAPSVNGGKWMIRGYKKGEILNLLSYSIKNAYIAPLQTTWKGVTGGNE